MERRWRAPVEVRPGKKLLDCVDDVYEIISEKFGPIDILRDAFSNVDVIVPAVESVSAADLSSAAAATSGLIRSRDVSVVLEDED